MTPDFQRLRDNLERLSGIIEDIEFELVDDPNWSEPSDTSYMSEAQRADPDIMGNVEAMALTNNRIAWFGRDDQGFVGLWRVTEDASLERAPVVRLDTEGQYDLVAASIPDYLAISMARMEFADVRRTLVELGFAVSATREDIWGAVDGVESPNDCRNEIYNQRRVRRGLDPV